MEPDVTAEPWRAALDLETINYTNSHYRNGVCINLNFITNNSLLSIFHY